MIATDLPAGPALDRAVADVLHLDPDDAAPWSTEPESGEQLVEILNDLGLLVRPQAGAAGMLVGLYRRRPHRHDPLFLASVLERITIRKEMDQEAIEALAMRAQCAALCKAVVKWGGTG